MNKMAFAQLTLFHNAIAIVQYVFHSKFLFIAYSAV